jgi:hypothetical protein
MRRKRTREEYRAGAKGPAGMGLEEAKEEDRA